MKKIVKKIVAVAMAMSLVGTGASTLKNDNVVSAARLRHASWCSRVQYPGHISTKKLGGRYVQVIHLSCACGYSHGERQITTKAMY